MEGSSANSVPPSENTCIRLPRSQSEILADGLAASSSVGEKKKVDIRDSIASVMKRAREKGSLVVIIADGNECADLLRQILPNPPKIRKIVRDSTVSVSRSVIESALAAAKDAPAPPLPPPLPANAVAPEVAPAAKEVSPVPTSESKAVVPPPLPQQQAPAAEEKKVEQAAEEKDPAAAPAPAVEEKKKQKGKKGDKKKKHYHHHRQSKKHHQKKEEAKEKAEPAPIVAAENDPGHWIRQGHDEHGRFRKINPATMPSGWKPNRKESKAKKEAREKKEKEKEEMNNKRPSVGLKSPRHLAPPQPKERKTVGMKSPRPFVPPAPADSDDDEEADPMAAKDSDASFSDSDEEMAGIQPEPIYFHKDVPFDCAGCTAARCAPVVTSKLTCGHELCPACVTKKVMGCRLCAQKKRVC